jgi:hypothetical protein
LCRAEHAVSIKIGTSSHEAKRHATIASAASIQLSRALSRLSIIADLLVDF